MTTKTSTTGLALCASLCLLLAGCGDDGGGSSSTKTGTTGKGTGADVVGYYHAAITSVSGTWATSNYVMKEMVFPADIAITGIGEVEIFGPSGPFTLTWSPASGKYEAEITYADTDPDSPYNGSNVTESWTLWQSGGKVHSAVSVTNDADDRTSSVSATMYEPYFPGKDWSDGVFRAMITSSSPAVWNKGALQVLNQGDAVWFARDNYNSADMDADCALYRDGTAIKGAGFGGNASGDDIFVTCALAMAGSGDPLSGSLAVYNRNQARKETLSFDSAHGQGVLGALISDYAERTENDYTITAMTAGGNLASIFPGYDAADPLTHTYAIDEGYGMETSNFSFDMYFEDTSAFGELSPQRPAWNGGTVMQFVDYGPDDGSDFPYYGGPEEYSYQVTLAFDPATGLFTGGTLKLYEVDADGGIANPETMQFTFSAPRPNITSSLAVGGTEGGPFSFDVLATRTPTSFGATGLPAGLSISPTTGVISGIPTVDGVFYVTLTATNAGGTDTETLVLTIDPAPPAAP